MKVIQYFFLIITFTGSHISHAENQCEQLFNKNHVKFMAILEGKGDIENQKNLVEKFKKCMSSSPKSCSIQSYSKSLMRGPTLWSVHSYSLEDLKKIKWSMNTRYVLYTISSNDKCLIVTNNGSNLHPTSIYAIKNYKVIDVFNDPGYVNVPLGHPGTIKEVYDKIHPDYK